VGAPGVVEVGQKLPLKERSDGPHREQKPPPLAAVPSAAIGTEAAAGDNAVEVDVVDERLRPGVQDRGDADFGPEVFRIAGEGGEGVTHGAKQQIVESAGVGANERVERVRQRKDHVEVGDRQQERLLRLAPVRLREGLALWAMPIAAGVVDGARPSARVALFAVPAQGGGAAALDGAEQAGLRAREPMGGAIACAEPAHDVGQLPVSPSRSCRRGGRPAHALGVGLEIEQVAERAAARQGAGGQVQVARGCLDAAVPHETLDGVQIHAGVDEMRGEGVPQ
jgi:hypothetical protein